MWQKVSGKYHWVLGGDQLQALEGWQAMTYCQKAVVVQQENQVPYVTEMEDRCEFCDGVSNIIHTAAYEAIRYSVKNETRVDVLRRSLEFTSSVTLIKAIEQRIRKLSKVKKPEYRSHKNIIYYLSKSEGGWSFSVPDFNIQSECFEQHADAMENARKQIEISKLKKVFSHGQR